MMTFALIPTTQQQTGTAQNESKNTQCPAPGPYTVSNASQPINH